MEPTVNGGRTSGVRLAVLGRYDCWRLVTEAGGPTGIARVVWSGPHGPQIVPVNYVVAGGDIWFQTSPDSRFAQECVDQRVLVEVDHVDPVRRTGWSVVVTGPIEVVPAHRDPGILSQLEVWPRGDHLVLVRVEAEDLTGRRLMRDG